MMADEDHLQWDDYFMALASLASMRSKDPHRKVGACVVNEDRRVVALGYNGMPNGTAQQMPWGRDGQWEDTKYPFVCHAEMNAIMNKTSADLKNCVIYTTLFPCNECVKLIIQAGIRRVHYMSNKHGDRPTYVTARRLMDTVNIHYSQHIPRRRIVIDFDDVVTDDNYVKSTAANNNMETPTAASDLHFNDA